MIGCSGVSQPKILFGALSHTHITKKERKAREREREWKAKRGETPTPLFPVNFCVGCLWSFFRLNESETFLSLVLPVPMTASQTGHQSLRVALQMPVP